MNPDKAVPIILVALALGSAFAPYHAFGQSLKGNLPMPLSEEQRKKMISEPAPAAAGDGSASSGIAAAADAPWVSKPTVSMRQGATLHETLESLSRQLDDARRSLAREGINCDLEAIQALGGGPRIQADPRPCMAFREIFATVQRLREEIRRTAGSAYPEPVIRAPTDDEVGRIRDLWPDRGRPADFTVDTSQPTPARDEGVSVRGWVREPICHEWTLEERTVSFDGRRVDAKSWHWVSRQKPCR